MRPLHQIARLPLAVQFLERGPLHRQEEHELEGVRVLPELRDVLRQAGARQISAKDVAALVEAGEPADSRLIQHLLADVMGDGGQWTMAMNV